MNTLLSRLITLSAQICLCFLCLIPPTHAARPLGHATEHVSEWSWLTEKWNGDDRPYLHTVAGIDKISNRKTLLSLLKTYQRQQAQQPQSALALFRLALVVYNLASEPTVSYAEGYQELGIEKINIAFQQVPSPRTYSYARLRFLIASYIMPIDLLKTVGERLLKHNPTDSDVQFYLVRNHTAASQASERARGIACAQDLVRKFPARAAFYSLLGFVYHASWIYTHSKSDALKAVSAYRRYLDLAPADATFRTGAQDMIDKMQNS